MERIINGVKFSTGAAERLGMWDNDIPHDEFDYCCVVLYKQPEGYFLYRNEPFSRSSTGKVTRRESIRSIDKEEARAWARLNLPYPEYERIFG